MSVFQVGERVVLAEAVWFVTGDLEVGQTGTVEGYHGGLARVDGLVTVRFDLDRVETVNEVCLRRLP